MQPFCNIGHHFFLNTETNQFGITKCARNFLGTTEENFASGIRTRLTLRRALWQINVVPFAPSSIALPARVYPCHHELFGAALRRVAPEIRVVYLE